MPAVKTTLVAAAVEAEPHNCAAFLTGGRDALVAALQKESADLAARLVVAEAEAAAWRRIDGTPRLNEATKNRHVKDHLHYWDAQVKALKSRLSEVQTDLDGLPLIQG